MMEADLTGIDWKELHYYLRLTREVDEKNTRLYRQGRLMGDYFPQTGQEATTVVPTFLAREDDFIAPSHRELGAFLTKDHTGTGALQHAYLQLFGSSESESEAKANPGHYGDRERNYLRACTLVASQIPVAAGAGLSFKMRGDDSLALSFFGEGATSKGIWHEGLNFAGIHNLPVIYTCQNNLYAESVPLDLQAGGPIYKRAEGYGFEGIREDGNDVVSLVRLYRDLLEDCRAGEGPFLVELMTYRHHGHSMVDPAGYRADEEEQEWLERDPVDRFEDWLTREDVMTESEINEQVEEIRSQIDEAIDYAENEAERPDGPEALERVYA